MSEIKNKRIKEQKFVLTIILLASSGLCIFFGLLIKDKESKLIIMSIGFALLAGFVITRMFKGTFGYKPTREEIEEKMFRKD